ncbi:DNA polymerase III subunit gamma and tau [Galbitalea soli]|uniref:DNA polymerase III subunit gamma/tau n=1 Tax=Galbitalea soli TaxID=1268042 RepID=A0A7C9PPB2_9MICO|nr:DNA polymerase III subunit gamma and tau [Galbitalea soli]NYJ31876.1 DNA polymerase-3 subunit gamma/tau [Galbitalea soli]
MVTALYRRYRPETFAELIGQSQVTDPLRTALRTDRVNHAYLFSGPRGCGKTTSARILARCLNCAEGPTDTPCGVCPSCVELSRDGGGSLDVVEIDAASHNGVDDARDLRERAVFAPARDRFKIFILDEAHMVTPQGFNALLKIVEEPPEHVKFIFATTEPEKVIGTIRSRTHHYPFRLVPPAQMLEYVQTLCESEGITVAPGVLPLVVRAGGGSVRDTLSLLDQLMAGSEDSRIEYERAVALLGYTHGALLDEVVDAIGAQDAAAAFTAVDRVIQTGQDPRRFVEDLLERLRDLIIVAATADGAAAVLRGIPQDELDRMAQQSHAFGAAELSRAADVVNAALTEMTGATSPRLHLELMVARVLVPASDETERGALARVERLERRIGVESTSTDARPAAARTPETRAAPPSRVAAPIPPAAATAPTVPTRAPATAAAAPASAAPAADAPSSSTPHAESAPPTDSAPPAESAVPAESAPPAASAAPVAPAADGPVTLQQMRDAWPEILESVKRARRSAWMVVFTSQARALQGDVLTVTFPSENDVANFKQTVTSGEGVSETLRKAIVEVLGLRVKFIARVETSLSSPAASAAAAAPAGATPAAAPSPAERMPAPAAAARPAATPPAAAPAAAAPARTAPRAATPPPSVPLPPEPDDFPEPLEPDLEPDPGGWAVATIPASPPAPATKAPRPPASTASTPPASQAPASQAPASQAPASEAPASTASTPPVAPSGKVAPPSKRYGESVVREILGANFIEEQKITPRVTPRID